MQGYSAYPDMVMMSPDHDGHPQQQIYQDEAQQQTYHQIGLHQDGALQGPYYQCTEQNPLDEMMLDPVLRSDVAEDRPFVHTPVLTPGILYDSFRNLSSLYQLPATFVLSPALQILRGVSILENVE